MLNDAPKRFNPLDSTWDKYFGHNFGAIENIYIIQNPCLDNSHPVLTAKGISPSVKCSAYDGVIRLSSTRKPVK